jgi:hypothetical protein
MQNEKRKNKSVCLSFCILHSAFCITFWVFACAQSAKPPAQTGPTPAQERYLQSQANLMRGAYEQAYRDYQKATTSEPALADVAYLSSILYSWAISQSDAADISLLEAQKQVSLTPGQFAPRKALLSIAVNREANRIRAFGVGLSAPRPLQANQERVLAREAAMVDAHAWAARIARWAKQGVEAPFDISGRVRGVQQVGEFWLIPEVCVVKVEAPLEQEMGSGE